ncbi:MAG: DHH family phosphoesterase [Nanoarchaeota archaeon]|nr:DHH family phosphoesterase [Nanoarchaeota archaeon]
MGEVIGSLEVQIDSVASQFLEESKTKEVLVISHFDTDGISSAAIMGKTLKKLDIIFSLKIVKSLKPELIANLPENKIILFLDLASGSLSHIQNSNLKKVFIIDHHEIDTIVPSNVRIVNPQLNGKEKISSSGLVYLFCKKLSPEIKNFAKLAILGMVGDQMEKEIDKLNHEILDHGEIKKKRGLLIYPATRPLNRTLEYASHPYIPGVTGDQKGVIELLREAGLAPKTGKYKSVLELDSEEMERLVTGIMLRNPKARYSEIIGDVFLIKMYNKLEDARELSAMVNACSRFGESNTALQLLMEVPKAKKKAESIYIKHKQNLISGLDFVSKAEKIKGRGYIIINTKDNVKDTIVGTIASILSYSPEYTEGTIITTMAYYEDKIKVSSRSVGKNGRNVREILSNIINQVGGEVGGHEFAAGCILKQDKEEEFIQLLKKNLEIEMIKV